MVLAPDTLQKTGLAEVLPLVLSGEGDMEAGDIMLARYFLQTRNQQRTNARLFRSRMNQQTRAGDRGEGNAALEFGIVIAAGAFIGIRPAPVENVFPVGMALEVERRRTQQLPSLVANQKMLGQPSGFAGRAAGL